jgi:hypothetical protein
MRKLLIALAVVVFGLGCTLLGVEKGGKSPPERIAELEKQVAVLEAKLEAHQECGENDAE